MAERHSTIDINVQANLQGVTDKSERPEVWAYAFTRDGSLLDHGALDAHGRGTLHVAASSGARALRLVIGPRPAEKEKEARLSELIRRGAREKLVRLDPKGRIPEAVFEVPSIHWSCWILNLCFVPGTLYKRVKIGGQYVNYPVCGATVEVYEVDPIFIVVPKLPDSLLDKLRHIVERQPPIVGPHGPGPDPGPLKRLLPVPPNPGDPAIGEAHLLSLNFPADLQIAATLGNRFQFEQALILHADITRYLLCILHPPFVTKQLVATAETDECGHFLAVFSRGCNNADTPDLYFKATQDFGFFSIPIYEPKPVGCYTYWDYPCGTEVTLYTTSMWAWTCTPCRPIDATGNWAAFVSIGNTSLASIRGAGTAPSSGPSDDGHTTDGRPFGGFLRPRIEVSEKLNGIAKYYRVRWRKGTSGTFVPLPPGNSVTHYYRHDVAGNPAWSPYVLGPQAIGAEPDLYEIPFESVAPAGVWDAPPDDIREHFTSVKMPSETIAPGQTFDGAGNLQGTDVGGIYQLALELFDASGNIVPKSSIHFVVPTDEDLSGTIHTIDAPTIEGNAMVVTLHIDNNRCFALLDPPAIGTVTSEPCCGTLPYDDPSSAVTMSFVAKHPNGYETHSFRLTRGATDLTVPQSSPVVMTVHDLLTNERPAGCTVDCTVAGFAETLVVSSTATDGWNSDLGFGDSDVRAFVLQPKPQP